MQAIYVWDITELIGLPWPMRNVIGAELAGVDSERIEVHLRPGRGRVRARGPGASARRARGGRSARRMGRINLGKH
eukprot:5683919-Alexandrium_andersonii.AAC.1